jgi:tetratricopeptide (TPR) repeat protein
LYDLWHNRLDLYRQTALEAARYFDHVPGEVSARVEKAYHLFIGNPSEARVLCTGLIEEFQDTGRFDLWHSLNQGCLEHLAGGRLDQAGQALALESCGRLANVSGNRKEAIEKLERALDLYRAIGDKESEGGILFSISWNYNHEGLREKAVAALQSAHELFVETGNPWYAGESLFRIGEMREFDEEARQAYQAFEQALEMFDVAGAPLRQADALLYTGMLRFLPEEQELELYRRALNLYRQAWERYTRMSPDDPELSNPIRLSKAKMLKWRLYSGALNMGDCLREIGNREPDLESRQRIFVQAEEAYQQAVKPALDMFDMRWISRIRLRLGDIKVLLGRMDEALELYKKALEDAVKIDHKLYIGWAYVGLGDIDLASGDKVSARQRYLVARDLYLAVRALSNIRDQVEPRLARLDGLSEAGDVGQ